MLGCSGAAGSSPPGPARSCNCVPMWLEYLTDRANSQDRPLSDDPNLPFGHNTLKIRAVFIPDGAQVSMSDITRVVGFDPVFIRAVRVPPGGAPPGYPYEIIGQATFIPDGDDQERSTGTGSPLSRMRDDAVLPGNPMPQQPRGSGSPFASTAGPWAPATDAAGGNASSGGRAPRRGVRSAQANFSAAVPTPHLDTSHDAIDAAVSALSVRPTNWGYPSAASLAAPATEPGISLSPSQFPADLIGAVAPSPTVDGSPGAIAVDALEASGSFGIDTQSDPAIFSMSQPSWSPDQQQRGRAARAGGAAEWRAPVSPGKERQYSTDVRLLPDDPTYFGVDHECVALVRKLTGAPEAKKWDSGSLVRGNQTIQPGTAIATFDKGSRYRGHAAIYLGQDAKGLIVFDQWTGTGINFIS